MAEGKNLSDAELEYVRIFANLKDMEKAQQKAELQNSFSEEFVRELRFSYGIGLFLLLIFRNMETDLVVVIRRNFLPIFTFYFDAVFTGLRIPVRNRQRYLYTWQQ